MMPQQPQQMHHPHQQQPQHPRPNQLQQQPNYPGPTASNQAEGSNRNFDRFEYATQRPHQASTSTTPVIAPSVPPVAVSAAVPAPRVPLSDRDIYMLSLPSQDQPSYYDASDSSSSETEGPLYPLISNRGQKLHTSARYARRSKLGSYPHTDAGFPSISSSKRQKTLSGSLHLSKGFVIAPNLHLIPRRSPSPPALAVLPPPPQSPLDLLLSSALQHTFGPKNGTMKTLAMSATGLIEQEGALIGSLRRVCAGLRGEGFEFRWEGDEEVKREREREEERELLEMDRWRRAETIRMEAADKVAKEEEEKRLAEELEAEAALAVERAKLVAEAEDQTMEDSSSVPVETTPATTAPLESTSSIPAPVIEESTDAPVVSTEAASLVEGVDAAGDGDTTMENIDAPSLVVEVEGDAVVENNVETPAVAEEVAKIEVLPVVEGEVLPVEGEETKVNGDQMVDVAEEAGEGELIGEGEEGHDSEEPTRRRSGRVASRAGDPTRARSGSTSTESDEPIAAPLGTRFEPSLMNGTGGVADEEMPEYAKRMVDPEVFVRSLFVTEGVVGVPISIQGGPPGSTDVDLLSPNEQEVMVHDCLTDLHRFMADSLEYRSRLSEIRDGVLGVERRRKGMWKLIRMISSDWLEEESAAHENE